MKRILLALSVLIFTASLAHAAEVKPWEYKGTKNWYDLTGQPITVSYAETQVDDDKISVLYAPASKSWYIQFSYISEYMLVDKQPEFFVRTTDTDDSGRYASDYLIQKDASIFNNTPGKPHFIIMPLAREDLAAIKTDLNIGASFYVSDKVSVIEGETLDLGRNISYLFLGTNASTAIAAIEQANNLSTVRANSAADRKAHQQKLQEDSKNIQLLQWYEGNWAETTPNGTMRWGGCDAKHEIDYDRFSNLVQRNKFLVQFNGILAISANGGTKPDEIHISTAYNRVKNDMLAPMFTSADTKRIPLIIEDGDQFVRLRLGTEVPGIPYKRIIDYENDMLKFVAYDTHGEDVAPIYFKRCN